MGRAFAVIITTFALILSLNSNGRASNSDLESPCDEMRWKLSIRFMEPAKLFWGSKGDWAEKDLEESLADPVLGDSLKNFMDYVTCCAANDERFTKHLVIKKGDKEIAYKPGGLLRSLDGVTYDNHVLEHLRYLVDFLNSQNGLKPLDLHGLGYLLEALEFKKAKTILDVFQTSGELPEGPKRFQVPDYHVKAFKKIQDANPDLDRQFQVHLARSKNGHRLSQDYVLKKVQQKSSADDHHKVSQLALLFALINQLNDFDPMGN